VCCAIDQLLYRELRRGMLFNCTLLWGTAIDPEQDKTARPVRVHRWLCASTRVVMTNHLEAAKARRQALDRVRTAALCTAPRSPRMPLYCCVH
jgi:hypothetical protein